MVQVVSSFIYLVIFSIIKLRRVWISLFKNIFILKGRFNI